MSGLIWASMGKAIADAGSTVGNMMYKGIEQDQRLSERSREKQEDREWREEQARLNRESVAERTASKGISGGDASGTGFKPVGAEQKEYEAMQAGMTLPEYEAMLQGNRTGDFGKFKQDKTTPARFSDAGFEAGQAGAATETTTTSEYPPGFESFKASKLKVIAEIRGENVHGKDWKNIADGRQTNQETDASAEAMANPKRAGIIGQGMAAGQGKDIIGGDSNVTRNKFTGETSVTQVGTSQINENNAQAGKASKDANRPDIEVIKTQADFTSREKILRTSISNIDGQITKAGSKDKKTLTEKREALGQELAGLLEQRKDFESLAKGSSRATAPPPAKAGDNSAGGKSTYKVGETRKIASGPNAGKTARWDGNGWTLAN